MARIRTIKPGFFASEDMAKLPLRARLTFAGLWTYCDDYGNANANPRLIKAALWSLDDDVTPADVQADLELLVANGQVILYEIDGRDYLRVVKWSSHQRVDRPSKSDIPASSIQAREDDANPREENPQEGEGEKEVEGRGEATLTPYCTKHPRGTDDPCRACGRARVAYEITQSEKKNRPTPTPPKHAPDPATCNHKYVAGWCARCEQAKPEAVA